MPEPNSTPVESTSTVPEEDAKSLFFADKAESLVAPPEDKPTLEPGDKTADDLKKEQSYAGGKYKSLEDFEKGHSEAQGTITKYSTENTDLRKQNIDLLKQIAQASAKPDNGDKPTLSPEVSGSVKEIESLLGKLDDKEWDSDSAGILRTLASVVKNQLLNTGNKPNTDEITRLQEVEDRIKQQDLDIVEMQFKEKHPKMHAAFREDVVALAKEFGDNQDNLSYTYKFWFDAVIGKNVGKYIKAANQHYIASMSEEELLRIRSDAIAGGSGIPSRTGQQKSQAKKDEELFFP